MKTNAIMTNVVRNAAVLYNGESKHTNLYTSTQLGMELQASEKKITVT